MISSILSFMEQLIGKAPDYFTVGSSNNPQWDYGALLEYTFAGLIFIITLAFIYKFIIGLVSR